MRRYIVVAFVVFSTGAAAQERVPTVDELAFARLPQDVRALLGDLHPREALQKYDYARQNLVALGAPDPSAEQLRAQIEAVLAPRLSAVQSVSAGTRSFPPLSPLVPAISFDYR